MAHWLSIAFFLGLLVALALVLEFTLKAHWAAIVAALRGVPPARCRRRGRLGARRAARARCRLTRA